MAPKKAVDTTLAFNTFAEDLDVYATNPNIEITPDGWVLPNRVKFQSWIASTFRYPSTGSKGMFINQRFVKDYMQPESPYRGLLLYHGLGTGKTCSSIIAAENLMSEQGVVILLPAALRNNYIGDIRAQCGNKYFTPKQHFHFVPLSKVSSFIDRVSEVTFVPAKLIRKNRGLWIPLKSESLKPNFDKMSDDIRARITDQLDAIIENKYQFMHYNGLNSKKLAELEQSNPFHDKVVVIDEVHNFISRTIGNGVTGKRLYQLLINATNCRIFALSGTPIINHPYEVAYLVNLLTGKQPTCDLKYSSSDFDRITKALERHPFVDDFEINGAKKIARIQLVPEGFQYINKPQFLVGRIPQGQATAETDRADDIARATGSIVTKNTDGRSGFLLPFDKDEFVKTFIDLDTAGVKNERMLARRMMGLISYYGKYDEETYPRVFPIKTMFINMPDAMFGAYEEKRIIEIKKEKQSSRNRAKAKEGGDALGSISQIYRVYSRTACNFVFPPEIQRPLPGKTTSMKGEMGVADDDDDAESSSSASKKAYFKKLDEALAQLAARSDEFLTIEHLRTKLSPKFAHVIQRVAECPGKSLIYSQFRLVEGLGVLSIALEANGWCEVKIKKMPSGDWDVSCADPNAPKFFQYRSNSDETKVLLDVLNNNLSKVPPSVLAKLVGDRPITDNLHGDIIKVMMITQSGAEGISLKHVREVHILEPYWNEIRINQVIGRAVRANSHVDLPKSERNVQVFRYIMQLPAMLAKQSKQIFINDDGQSTDEHIFNIATRKAKIIESVQEVMKSAAVDCMLHKKDHPKVDCLKFPQNMAEGELSYSLNMDNDESDMEYKQKTKTTTVSSKFRNCKLRDVRYAFREEDQMLYDLEAYKQGQLVQIGKLIKNGDRWRIKKQ